MLPFIVVVALRGGGGSSAQSSTPTPSPTPGLTNVGSVYFVDNDSGNDSFDCLAPSVAAAPLASGAVDGPCKTIQHAVDLTRDRDLVVVAAQEPIQLSAPILVSRLIGVIATGFSLTNCSDVVGGFGKVVLQSAGGGPVFHITAVGSPSLHTLIAGFILGGTTSFADPGAITLDHDAFTELRCNIVGQEDLPNVIGILTRGSEHPLIHDNTVHGSTHFPIAASLAATPPIGGLGLVTGECLGDQSRSDQLHLERNLFAFNSNAGIWICSDGSGGHMLQDNNLRSNGRGIVLLSAVDTTLRRNFIGDNYYDGVDILDASVNNTLEENQIESQEGPSSTGVLLQGSGALFPLGNTLRANQIRRNHVDVLVVGARATRLVDNSISAIGERTAVLFAIGNVSGIGGRDFGQPSSTTFRANKLYADGVCEALRGCAIRLLPGVTTAIDATGNDFGVTDAADIQAVIWDHARDAELGTVLFSGQLGVPVTPAGGAAPASTPGRTRDRASATATPIPLVPSTPAIVPLATPGPTATTVPASATSTPAPAAPIPSAASPSAAAGPVIPLAYIDPASGDYYVELRLCVTNAGGQAVGGDALSLVFFDGAGTALGLAQVTADAAGCFGGSVRAPGDGSHVQPARLAISDPSGASLDLEVSLGAPLTRPPSTPLSGG